MGQKGNEENGGHMLELVMGQIGQSVLKRLLIGTVTSFICNVIRFVGGFMIKLLVMGIIVSTISNLTGVPVFPVYPTIVNKSIKFESTSINQKNYQNFKNYIGSKF